MKYFYFDLLEGENTEMCHLLPPSPYITEWGHLRGLWPAVRDCQAGIGLMDQLVRGLVLVQAEIN